MLFRGASDPTNPVTVSGAEIKTDSNGYFSQSYDLKPGLNTFVIKHKDKTLTYNITRNVKIFQSVAPTGTLTVDGNTDITLTAMAYENAKITAVINGQTITLTREQNCRILRQKVIPLRSCLLFVHRSGRRYLLLLLCNPSRH